MKLLFCLFHYFPYGGLQRDCARVAQACIAAGDEVHIITQSWQGPQILGAIVHCFPMPGWTNHRKSERFSNFLLSYIKTHHYDGVVGFDKMPGLDIYYGAGSYRPKARGLKGLLRRDGVHMRLQAGVFSAQEKTHILLLNPAQQTILQQQYGTQAQRMHLLPPGIDPGRRVARLALEKRAQLRQENGVNPDDKILLFLGTSFRNKGLDRALAALASLPDTLKKTTQLWIAGKDKLFRYQFYIKRNHLTPHIKFLGASDHVPELLMQVDLLLHPAYLELTGTVILEALVAGVPVLTTAACGFAYYVEGSNAGKVIQEPFSQAQLNTALLEMLSDDALKKYKERAFHFSETQDVYRMPEVAVETIHRILMAN